MHINQLGTHQKDVIKPASPATTATITFVAPSSNNVRTGEKNMPRVKSDYDYIEPKTALEPPLPTSNAAQNHTPNPYINSNLTHKKIAAIRAMRGAELCAGSVAHGAVCGEAGERGGVFHACVFQCWAAQCHGQV